MFTLPIPEIERQRIEQLGTGIIIPESYYHHTHQRNTFYGGESVPHTEESYVFCTYHTKDRCLVEWIYYKDMQHRPYIDICLPNPYAQDIASHAKDSMPAAYEQSTNNTRLYRLYVSPIPLESETSIPQAIHHHAMQALRAIQSPAHFTQFMLACKALHTLMAKDRIPAFIAITCDPVNIPNTEDPEDTTESYLLYQTPDPAMYADHTLPNKYTTMTSWDSYMIERQQYEGEPHECTSHTIHAKDIAPWNDLFGPWMHPIMHQAQYMDGKTSNPTTMEYMHCTRWFGSEVFMPPSWHGYETLWDMHTHSQHAWMEMQRALASTIEAMRPYIHPYTRP